MDAGTIGGVLGGAAGGSALLWQVFRWSIERNVRSADEENKRRDLEIAVLKKKQEEIEKENVKLTYQLSSAVRTIEEVHTLLRGVQGEIERSRDKQAEFYRSELKRVEQELRNELRRLEEKPSSRRRT